MKVALVAIGRLENRYAVEWVKYYKKLGFNHIFIADNNYIYEEYFEDVLQPYINNKFIDIINYRDQEYIQCKSYMDIYNQYCHEYDYIAFFDFDEFLVLKEDKTIQDYLSHNENFDVICLNWRVYTDNNLLYDDGRDCIERFTEPTNKNNEINTYVKCIIRGNLKNIHFITPHVPSILNLSNKKLKYCNNDFNEIILENNNILSPSICYNFNDNKAYLKHFLTKTITEFIKLKLDRRNVDTCSYNYALSRINTFKSINNFTKEKEKILNDYLKNKEITIALIAIGRLENRYAIEWVEYYKKLGFNHIFIGDNNHNEESFNEVLQTYIDNGFITIFNYQNLLHFQLIIYNYIYYNHCSRYDYVAFFDFDEFLVLKEDKTIQDYLSHNENFDVICLNWRVYTDNNLLYDDGRDCIERFTEPTNKDNKYNTYVKSIVKTFKKILFKKNNPCIPYIGSFGETLNYCNNNFEKINIDQEDNILNLEFNDDRAYLKHFMTKTVDEFINNKLVKYKEHINVSSYVNDQIKNFFTINKKTKEKEMKINEVIKKYDIK